MPIMPIMPNMPIMPPQKHHWGRHLPRQGKESTTPFYPDAGRIAPTSASVMCQRFMLEF